MNLLLAAAFMQTISSSAISATSVALMSFALIWLAWRWLLVIRQHSQSVYWYLAEGFAIGIVGSGLTSPLDSAGLLYLLLVYGALTFHALSLAVRHVIISTLCYLLAYSTVLLYLLDGSPYEQLPRIGLLPLPGIAFLAVLSSLTARAVVTQSTMERIRQHLDHASSIFAAAPDREHIARATIEAVDRLLPSSCGPVCFLRHGDGETLIVQPGETSTAVITEPLPLEDLPASERDRLGAGYAIKLDRGLTEWISAGIDLSSTAHMLYGVPLRSTTSLAGLLVVGLPRSLQEEEIDALEALGRHASLAVERVQGLQNLRSREASYRSLVHHALDAMLVIAVNTTIEYETPAFGALRKASEAQLGERFTNLVHPDDVRSVTATPTGLLDQPDASNIFECRLLCADGSWVTAEVRAHNRLDDPAVGGIVLSCRDISERKQLEELLTHQAFHDPLTKLPNRGHFLTQLHAYLDRVRASPYRHAHTVAVLFLDLDRFKLVNDSLGHDAGDRLLRATAERLQDCVRPTDIVARFGGDEFAILLEDGENEAFTTRVAERIITALQAPVTIGGQQLFTSTSVGIAIAYGDAVEPEELLHRADAAMYAAKREGKGRYCIFNPSMVADSLERLQLETELHETIEQGRLELYYQPLISLETGQVSGLEALVRWPHPERGLLSPDSFVPLAEETGQILPLGIWVLEEVCRQIQKRRSKTEGTNTLFPISVNLSPLQFQQPRLAEDISRVLRAWSIPPHLLKLEITEGAMMRDERLAVATINQLRQMGVMIAIDDFGIGYSSLSALQRFSVDSFKIDRSFIAGLGHDTGDTALIEAMITYSKAVGMTVVAEGIENDDQLQRLKALGCDVGQGYFLAKPLPSLGGLRPVRLLETPTATEEARKNDAERVLPISVIRKA